MSLAPGIQLVLSIFNLKKGNREGECEVPDEFRTRSNDFGYYTEGPGDRLKDFKRGQWNDIPLF